MSRTNEDNINYKDYKDYKDCKDHKKHKDCKEYKEYKDFLFDTAVIGAGPAGLSAAIRARFIKSHGAYPMSAIVFDSSEKAGGLANFGGTKLSGPAFQLKRGELVSKLLKDIRLFDIPIVKQKVVEIKKSKRGGEEFIIKTATDAAEFSFHAKSVIIASGMRPLSNEVQYYNKGVEITYMGYDLINKMISNFIDDAARNDKKFIIYGNKYSLNLINFAISAINGLKVDFDKMRPLFLIEASDKDIDEITAGKAFKKYPFLFSFGKIIKFSGAARLEGITIESNGQLRQESADRVLLDYNSFELAPDFKIKIQPATTIFTPAGFIKTDSGAKTKIKGLYAAGDICGPYYSVSRAIASGITAAFSAYEFVMLEKKHVKNFSMFAYKASNFTPEADYREISVNLNTDKIAVLSKRRKIKKILICELKYMPDADFNKLLDFFRIYKVIDFNGFNKISKLLNISLTELSRIVEFMIKEKLASLY